MSSVGCVRIVVMGFGVLSRLGLIGCVVNVVWVGCHHPFVGVALGGATRGCLRVGWRCLLYVSSAWGAVGESVMVW